MPRRIWGELMNDDKRIVQMQRQVVAAVNAAKVPASVTVLVLESVLEEARRAQMLALDEKECDTNAQRHDPHPAAGAGH